MKLRDDHKLVIRKFEDKFPLPATDDEARIWTHFLCEQLAYSFPGEGWGHKSASPTRPHSADCIAIKTPFIGWDVVVAAGSAAAALDLGGESIDLTGQTFEPVSPVNWIGDTPPPDPLPPPTDLEARVAQLELKVAALESAARQASIVWGKI